MGCFTELLIDRDNIITKKQPFSPLHKTQGRRWMDKNMLFIIDSEKTSLQNKYWWETHDAEWWQIDGLDAKARLKYQEKLMQLKELEPSHFSSMIKARDNAIKVFTSVLGQHMNVLNLKLEEKIGPSEYSLIFLENGVNTGKKFDVLQCVGNKGEWYFEKLFIYKISRYLYGKQGIKNEFKTKNQLVDFLYECLENNLDKFFNLEIYQQREELMETSKDLTIESWWLPFLNPEIDIAQVFGNSVEV